jgi:hypothetical protein
MIRFVLGNISLEFETRVSLGMSHHIQSRFGLTRWKNQYGRGARFYLGVPYMLDFEIEVVFDDDL